jgi:diguanylate cyclase (GGDEF)-like protein
MVKLRSLRYQFIFIIVTITVVLTLIMGMMNIRSINIYSTEVANTGLNWQTQKTAGGLNRLMIRTQDAVDFVAGTIQQDFTTISQVQDPDFREDRKERIRRRFEAAAATMPIIDGFYIHFNEDLIQASDGFWYKRKNDQPGFEEQPFSHPRKSSNPMLEEKYRWYYDPLESLSPQWIPPYRNREGGPLLISYVKPVFVNRRCVALVGIDIRMVTLVDQVKNVRIYDSGYALLFSDTGVLYYHPNYAKGTQITTLKDFGLDHSPDVFRQHDTGSHTIPVSHQGIKKQLAFTTLANGMKLGVVAPGNEIYAFQEEAIYRAFFLLLLFAIFTSAIAIHLANRILRPLEEINEAASRMGRGNYDVPIQESSRDEIGLLAKNMNKTMDLMKIMVRDLKTEAFQDRLTRVKNVSAFEKKIQELNQQIRDPESQPVFGVVMVDLNGLKGVNDTYGHEKGNQVLQLTAKAICVLYQHSPVYRIGGDEFVVLVQNDDYANREALWQELLPYLRERDYTLEKPWEEIAFSAGHAEYQPGTDHSFEEVFRRADAAMYQLKRSIEGDAAR